jgi:hypothetical protein
MDDHDVYKPPGGRVDDLGGTRPGGPGDLGWGPVTPTMVEHLQGTRPWVLFLSILGFVFSGFMVIAALGMAAMGMASGDVGVAGGLALGLFYLILAFVYVLISLYLFRYATSIGGLTASRASVDMEDALRHQKTFWRVLGIMSVLYLVLTVVAVVVMVGVGFFAAATAS